MPIPFPGALLPRGPPPQLLEVIHHLADPVLLLVDVNAKGPEAGAIVPAGPDPALRGDGVLDGHRRGHAREEQPQQFDAVGGVA